MTEFFILLGLILLNGLLVMSEIALISAKKGRLEGSAAKGDQSAKTALKLQEKPEIFLSTAQTYITLISILTGVYSGEKFSIYFKPVIEKLGFTPASSSTIATVAIVIAVTFLSIIIGELIPKKLAMSRPETIAKGASRPMRLLSKFSYPIVWLLSNITNGIFKILNIKPSSETHVTEDEIIAMISEGSEQGAIEEDEKEIIERVFHLGDRNITSLMTHRTDIIWFDLDEEQNSIKAKIEQSLHSVYPVCDKDIDVIKGVVYVKEMYLNPKAQLSSLIKHAPFLPENNTAYQVLEKFKQTKIHYAFIVDEYGSVLGMITLHDILKGIVGEMPGHEEEEDYAIVERKDGSFIVDAQLQFYDFLTRFDKADWMNEMDQGFDTIAGFILHELHHIPKVGETFEWRGFEFEIVDMDNHRIDKVLVRYKNEGT